MYRKKNISFNTIYFPGCSLSIIFISMVSHGDISVLHWTIDMKSSVFLRWVKLGSHIRILTLKCVYPSTCCAKSGPVFYFPSNLLKLSKLWDPNFSFNYLKQIHFLSQCFENLLKQGIQISQVSLIPDLVLSQTSLVNNIRHKTAKTDLLMKIEAIFFNSLLFCICCFCLGTIVMSHNKCAFPVTSRAHG